MKLGRFNTISNYISLLRVFLAIPFWFLLNTDSRSPNYVAALLALFAVVTDLTDGYLARKFNQVTEWGKILDPLADKVCIAVIVTQLYLHNAIIPALFWIVILRDLLIVAASLLLSSKINKFLPSNYLGKITVLVICFYLLFIMLNLQHSYSQVDYYFSSASLGMIVISIIGYAIRAKEFITGNNNK